MDPHDSDVDGASNNDEEDLSEPEPELHDEDSEDGLSRLPVEDVGDQEILKKLKQEREEREEIARELKVHHHVQHSTPSPRHSPPSNTSPVASAATPTTMLPPPSFSLPLPFPFPHPATAFLPPISSAAPPPPMSAPSPSTLQPAIALQNSLSSTSSESSTSSQQTWSFEEQFKQVRQLYEINDDPKRKEFLDDLFSYMQKRGTPINRLPIMAKSVLDLYELYNLVIARGGLVDVINKKLWQEIIKGLHLPSSITSAAFTLRTQYMKYLYPYECEKRRLSTPQELQAAIDGNRREGRRSSYGTYSEMVQRSPMASLPPTHPSQMSPLSLVTGSRPAMNGNSNHHHHHHHHPSHHPSHPTPHGQPIGAGPIPGLAPTELEARMADYVKFLHKEFAGNGGATTPPGSLNHRQESSSPPTSTSPQEAALNALGMSRLTLWNICNSTAMPPPPPAPAPAPAPEPQKEALNLEVRDQNNSTPAPLVKREINEDTGLPHAKRLHINENDDTNNQKISHGTAGGINSASGIGGAHIKITSRGDGRTGMDNSLVVSMEINGVLYQGVLFAQNMRTRMT